MSDREIAVIATPMTGAEVARRVFRRTPDWIYRKKNRDHLRAMGFPEPGPFGWDPVEIAAWQARQRRRHHEIAAAPPPVDPQADHDLQARLTANAAAVAARLAGKP